MRFLDPIPEEYQPQEKDHVEYNEIYRATINTDKLDIQDFMPTYLCHKSRANMWRKINSSSFYSLSLFSDLESLKNAVNASISLSNSIRSFSKGFTTLNRGISTKEAPNKHINYFLFDHKNNNPYPDFKIIERRSIDERRK